VNKFEALKQFQGWHPDWQRLCAEYWIETGEVEPTQVLTFGDKIQTAGELIQRDPIPMPTYQPKAEKVADPKKPRVRTKYTLQELDFLDNLIYSELGPTLAVKSFCKRFPNSGHPKESLNTKFYKRKKELIKRGDL
jgi:hypothetical protein